MKADPKIISKNKVKGRNGGTLNPLSKGDPPRSNGRPKGSKNRSTILTQIFESVITSKNPFTKKDEKMSIEMAMAYSMVEQVIKKGNVNAWNSAKDDVYGKLTDKIDHTTKDEKIIPNSGNLTKEQLIEILKDRGLPLPNFDKG